MDRAVGRDELGTAGSSYNTTAVASITANSTGQHSYTVTSLVQSWVDGSASNHGFMVGSPDGGGNRTVTYTAREGTPDPILEITYTPPSNPRLSVAKSVLTPVTTNLGADTTIVDAGDRIVYQYIITNNGNVTISAVTPVDVGPRFGTAQVAGTGTHVVLHADGGHDDLAAGPIGDLHGDLHAVAA